MVKLVNLAIAKYFREQISHCISCRMYHSRSCINCSGFQHSNCQSRHAGTNSADSCPRILPQLTQLHFFLQSADNFTALLLNVHESGNIFSTYNITGIENPCGIVVINMMLLQFC